MCLQWVHVVGTQKEGTGGKLSILGNVFVVETREIHQRHSMFAVALSRRAVTDLDIGRWGEGVRLEIFSPEIQGFRTSSMVSHCLEDGEVLFEIFRENPGD